MLKTNELVRHALASMPSDHDAAGDHRPTVDQIFTPVQHANALDPNTAIVVGSRGTGKSFWAGVLEQEDTRNFAAAAYPHIGLNRLVVRAAYTGFAEDVGVSAEVIDARVPMGREHDLGVSFWTAVVVRAARTLESGGIQSVKRVMEELVDPEDAGAELRRLDEYVAQQSKILLITFDALDTWSHDWRRSTALTDALFKVVWSLRARRAIKAKVFIRPEQLNDDGLKFVELPKLRSGRVQLEWNLLDLYGLLFWRLSTAADGGSREAFERLVSEEDYPVPQDILDRRREWKLLLDHAAQEKLMVRIAGPYMGRGNKKGKTYEWPYKHLADARGEVTPRSFLKLFVEAAKSQTVSDEQVLTAEGIRHGLREASKVRVDQLGIEYKWVKRALAPLAGLIVPCSPEQIYERWQTSNTLNVILTAASDAVSGFLPPFQLYQKSERSKDELLSEAMVRIGVFDYRTDGRIDIPDLFRVAAKMLKKGGVAPG